MRRRCQPYLWEYCAELEPVGDALILDISYPDEDGGHWFEGEARLSALAPLRDDILAGDYRTLYLAWLLAAAANDGAPVRRRGAGAAGPARTEGTVGAAGGVRAFLPVGSVPGAGRRSGE